MRHAGPMRRSSPATSAALFGVVLAAVLTGCSASSDAAGPAAGSSTATGSATSAGPSTSPSAPAAPADPSATALSTPQAQASALVSSLTSTGAISADQAQLVQTQLATALADPSTQAQLKQVCPILSSGQVSDSDVAKALGSQLSGTSTSLDEAQAKAFVTALRTGVCGS